MNERPYSNREIDALVKTVITKIDDYAETDKAAHRTANEKLDRIEGQTTKTNGRVNKLERWQSYVIGFCACITIIMLPVALLLVQLYFKLHG